MTDIISGVMGDSAAQSAGSTLSGGYTAANSAIQGLQSTNVSNVTANEQPYTSLGAQAVGDLSAGEAAGGQFSSNFNLSDLTTDPGYLFDLQQGQQAVTRAAAASGTLNSGGTLKALDQYTTGLASNEITNAYNRYTTNQNNQFSRLYSLAGLGQNATSAVNAADTNQANVDSNATQTNTVGAAGATAAGTIAGTNALTGGITSAFTGTASNPSQAGTLYNVANSGASLASLAALF